MSKRIIVSILVIVAIIGLTAVSTLYISQRVKTSAVNDKVATIFVRVQATAEKVFKADLSKMGPEEGDILLVNSLDEIKHQADETHSLDQGTRSQLRDSLHALLVNEAYLITFYKMAHEHLAQLVLTMDTLAALKEYDENFLANKETGRLYERVKFYAGSLQLSASSFQDDYIVVANQENDLIKKMTMSGSKFTVVFEKYKDVSLDHARQMERYADKFLNDGFR